MPGVFDPHSLELQEARAINIYCEQKYITAHALIVGTGSILQLKSSSHDRIRFHIYNAVLYTVKIMPSKQCSSLIVMIHRPLRPSEEWAASGFIASYARLVIDLSPMTIDNNSSASLRIPVAVILCSKVEYLIQRLTAAINQE